MSQPTIGTTYDQHRHENLDRAFRADRFDEISEKMARFFGTPKYIVGQSVLVLIWILLNTLAIRYRWDPYPFILLNLAFSTQAAYATPLILLAQTRQAERDRAHEEAAANHRDELAANLSRLLRENTALTEHVAKLSREIDELTQSIHAHVVRGES